MRSLLIGILIAPLIAVASPLPEYPFVYVQGTAIRDVEPDTAKITFRMKTYDTDSERAFTKLSEVTAAVLEFIAKVGVRADDILARAIEKRAVRNRSANGWELEILGHENVRLVEISLKELSKFPPLIEFLYKQDHVEGISVEFGRSDETSILLALTKDACVAATANARRLSDGFQVKLGRTRAISESGFSGLGSAFGFPAGFDRPQGIMARESRDFRVIPVTVPFRKTVYAIFEVE